MPTIEIGDLGSIGVVRDQEGFVLPPEGWTHALNMRSVADGIERIGGLRQVFGTPTVAPHFAISAVSPTKTYWLYTSLTKAYVWDGLAHSNITRQTSGVDVDYTALHGRDWNGTILGGVPILNNGSDPPQYWPAFNTSTRLQALSNWPANTKTRVMRSFGPYLVALRPTEGTTEYPHVVRWSHPADPGSLPSSWDYTDATKDAGRNELPDVQAGGILDGLPLRGVFYIYKESSTWRMALKGGRFVFDFDTFLETSGILAPRCVAVTADGMRHAVATQDDLILHNGNSVEFALPARYKRTLFNSIDTSNYLNSFVFANPFQNEIMFCYPEQGNQFPNRALIVSSRGAITEAEVTFRGAAVGNIEEASEETWADNPTVQWDTDDGGWSQLGRRKVIAFGTQQVKFFEFDTGTLRDGSSFDGVLQREGLALLGRKRNGEWVVDFERRKMLRRLWIKATGGPITVRVGFQEQMNGSISWSTPQSFNPAAQHYVDVFGSGRAVGVEFKASAPFKLVGYKIDLEAIGDGI